MISFRKIHLKILFNLKSKTIGILLNQERNLRNRELLLLQQFKIRFRLKLIRLPMLQKEIMQIQLEHSIKMQQQGKDM